MNIFERLLLKIHRFRFMLMFPKQYRKANIWGPFSIIHPENLNFGKNFALNDYCYINATHDVIIGNNVAISSGAKLITIKLRFSNHSDYHGDLDHVGSKIVIGNNVQIGANAIILPGVTICDNVIVGAGSVVSQSIDEKGIYVGIPAKKKEKK